MITTTEDTSVRKYRSFEIQDNGIPVETRMIAVINAIMHGQLFNSDVPSIDMLFDEARRSRFFAIYDRQPDQSDALPVLSPGARLQIRLQAKFYQEDGRIWYHGDKFRIGVTLTFVNELARGVPPAILSSIVYAILHIVWRTYRKMKALTLEITGDELVTLCDPAGTDKNTRTLVKHALHALKDLVVVFAATAGTGKQFTPVLKELTLDGDNFHAVINEYFVAGLIKVIAGTKGVQYFMDSPTRLLLANCPPRYTPNQAKLQTLLFACNHTPRKNDPSGLKVISRGTVGDWMDKLAYGDARQKRRLDDFLADIDTVLRDAGATMDPDVSSLRAMRSADAFLQIIRILLPADFAASRYPAVIEERSGLKILGSGIDSAPQTIDRIMHTFELGMGGDDLKRYRKLNLITQADLAARIGISLRQLNRLETGASPLTHDLTTRIYAGINTFIPNQETENRT